MVAGASMAEDVSQCPANTVPLQIMTKGYGPDITFSPDKISKSLPRYRTFVTAVTERIVARLAKDKLCLDSAESKERSLLHFENWPLTDRQDADRQPASMPPLEVHPTGGGCRLTSPWMDLAFERKPVPWIRGIVRWNERQLLADQAVLDGVKNIPPGMAIPLTNGEFGEALWVYKDPEHLGKQEAKPREERIPPDILWLFRHSWQVEYGQFLKSVLAAMSNATAKGADSYTKLAIALIDRCFDADGATLQYHSILDAADLIQLERYKIDTLTY